MEVVPYNQTLVLNNTDIFNKFQSLQNRKRQSQFICAETMEDLQYYLRTLPSYKFVLLYFHKVEPNVDEKICLTNLRDRYFKLLVVVKIQERSCFWTFLRKFNKQPQFMKRHSCLVFRNRQLIFPNPCFPFFDTKYHNDEIVELSKLISSTLTLRVNHSRIISDMFGSNVKLVDPRDVPKRRLTPGLKQRTPESNGKVVAVKHLHKMSFLLGICISTLQKQGKIFHRRVARMRNAIEDIYGKNFLSIIFIPFHKEGTEAEKEYISKLDFIKVFSESKLQQVQGAVTQFFSLRSLPKLMIINLRRIRNGNVSYRIINKLPKGEDKLLRKFELEKMKLLPVKKYYKIVLTRQATPNSKRKKLIEKMRSDIAELNSDNKLYDSLKVILSCRNLVDRHRILTNTVYHLRKKKIVGLLFVRNGCSGSDYFVNVISEFHNRIRDRDPNLLEIIYISYEKNERRSIEYMNDHDLNAKSIPWDYEATTKKVKVLFGVRSCPRCFFINFAKNARGGSYIEIRLDELRRMKNYPFHMISNFVNILE